MLALILYSHINFQQSNPTVLEDLLDGNKRFVSQQSTHPRQDADARNLLAKGQKPKAVVVCCSDSRVAPEIIFDQGLGDLFVVRTAGNSVDKLALGSIEYAVLELKCKLIVVVGHEKCGAVKATIEGHQLPGALPTVLAPIRHAVKTAKLAKGDLLQNSVRQHVRDVVTSISSADKVMRSAVATMGVKVVGGTYSLDTGSVSLVQQAK